LEPTDKLSRLQQDLLQAFFSREQRFFLTGGAALAGFYLSHRETKDIDLFTTDDILIEAVSTLEDIARDLEASIEAIETSPDFRRFLVRQEQDGVMVDLVRDRVPQSFPEKRIAGIIRLDPPEEILVNKLCALLSRAEIRDLIDVYALERGGYPIEEALPLAARKDGGLTPAQLSWLLSQIRLDQDAKLPGGFPVKDLQIYLDELIVRLANLSFPAS